MRTQEVASLHTLFFVAILAGLLFGNLLVVMVGLLPLFLVWLGLLIEPPLGVRVRRTLSQARVWVGDEVEVTWEVEVRRGMGMVALVDPLPETFTLVKGSNLRVMWKGPFTRVARFSYRVRCAKRGAHQLESTRWSGRHFLGLYQTREGQLDNPVHLTVTPRILQNLRRVRSRQGQAIISYPMMDVARSGVISTDFRELRQYVRGDPVRFINWKASARASAGGKTVPMVNEYEREGKKAVWLFIDAAPYMEAGTALENSLESAVAVAGTLAHYFIGLGYRVGACIYNHHPQIFYPDTGKRQQYKLSLGLTKLTAVSPQAMGLVEAVERCRKYMEGQRPLNIVITRLDAPHNPEFLGGIRKLMGQSGSRRYRSPTMVVGLNGYHFQPQQDQYDSQAAMLLHWRTRPKARALRHMGVVVVEWDPHKESLAAVLTRSGDGRARWLR